MFVFTWWKEFHGELRQVKYALVLAFLLFDRVSAERGVVVDNRGIFILRHCAFTSTYRHKYLFMSGVQHPPKGLISPTKALQRGGNISGAGTHRPTTAPVRPVAERPSAAPRRASLAKVPPVVHTPFNETPLSASELEAVRAVWDDLVVSRYRSTIETVDELVSLFQALHVRLLPDVEEYAVKAFTSNPYNGQMEYDQFSEFVSLCKHQHDLCLKRNPLLMDDLLDAFVALGGQWDTKGSLDNEKMRKMIKQYGIRVDFDKFLEVVDIDGDAMVDFDEFKQLVEDVEGFSNRPLFSGDGTLELTSSIDFAGKSPKRRRGMFVSGDPDDGSSAAVAADDLSSSSDQIGSGVQMSKAYGSNPLNLSYSAAPAELSIPSLVQQSNHKAPLAGSSSSSTANKSNPPKPASPRRASSFLVAAGMPDPLALLAKRVAAAGSGRIAQPLPPSVVAGGVGAPPLTVSSFYRQVGLAVTNTCDLETFRERCAPLMKATARTEKREKSSALRTQNARTEELSEAVNGNQQEGKRVEAFLKRMSMNPESKQGLLAERRMNLKQKRIDEERQKKLRKRRADAKERATAQCFAGASMSHSHDAASSPKRANSIGSFRDGSRRASFASPTGQRRRSGAPVNAQGALDELPLSDEEEDDGMNSVYSTSSSQRSDDDKRHNFNFFHHLARSGKSTPTLTADAPQNEDTNSAATHVEGGATGRRRSLTNSQAAGGSSKAAANAVKMKLRDKLLLSSTPTVRLTGNSNQVRCDKVRPNPEEDEAAKARARVPQVPASKLTPSMRAQVAGLTIGEKKENCRVDENGQQRNELNAKLYACYHGRF